MARQEQEQEQEKSSSGAPVTVQKEMGLTPADFLRTLPAAVAGHPWSLEEQGGRQVLRLAYAAPERAVQISLEPAPERRIAALCLTVTQVTLCFENFSDAQQEAFLQRFDLYFQRGGG